MESLRRQCISKVYTRKAADAGIDFIIYELLRPAFEWYTLLVQKTATVLSCCRYRIRYHCQEISRKSFLVPLHLKLSILHRTNLWGAS